MSNEQIIDNQEVTTPEVVETPAVPEITAVVPEPEVVYEYQPVDDLGRKLGNKQVFKGKTFEEVLEKVANANKELIKLNRELKKNLRLGIVDKDELPEDAVTFTTEASFAPRQLTDEERFQLSRDLLDPDKFDAAADMLLEAKIGAKPQVITQALAQTQEEVNILKAKAEAEAFVAGTPQYFACKENFETITNWMVKNNLKPTRNNFRLAFDTLSSVGLLYEAPIVREEPVKTVVEPTVALEQPAASVTVQETPANPQPGSEDSSRITATEPPQAKRSPKAASGFTRDTTQDVGPTAKSTKFTVKEIEKMSSEEYRKRMRTDPNFAKEVDELYSSKK